LLLKASNGELRDELNEEKHKLVSDFDEQLIKANQENDRSSFLLDISREKLKVLTGNDDILDDELLLNEHNLHTVVIPS
jgi:hypothetical protein